MRAGARAATWSPTENRRWSLAVVAGGDLVGADVAVDVKDGVGETVEVLTGVVASVDHRVIETVAVGVPPLGQYVAVEVEFVVDDVEVPGGFEVRERLVDVTRSKSVGGSAVVRVAEPMGDA